MKNFLCMMTLLMFCNLAIAEVKTEGNLVVSVKANSSNYCFLSYQTADRAHTYLATWDCHPLRSAAGDMLLKIATLAYITGQPTTITLSSTGKGTTEGDYLTAIEVHFSK